MRRIIILELDIFKNLVADKSRMAPATRFNVFFLHLIGRASETVAGGLFRPLASGTSPFRSIGSFYLLAVC